MIVKGLDHGYLFTKDNENRKFRSAYARIDNSLADKYKIIIDGETYYFGSGNTTVDVDKTDNKLTKISTLANLAMTGLNEYLLVAGLPIIQYKDFKDKFAENIMSYNKCEVVYQGKQFKPQIKDVTVLAQGVGAMFGLNVKDGEYIVFDIGSYTINIALIEVINGIPYIIKFDTWFKGVLTLYNDIIKEVNRMYKLTLPPEYAEKILKEGLVVDAEQKDTKWISALLNDYLVDILSKFKANYPYAVTPILLHGGGGSLLKEIFDRMFKNYVLLGNSQFANAIGYYNFGVQKYGNLLERRSRYA